MPYRRKATGDSVAFMSFPRRHGPTDLGRRPALWVTIPESGGGDGEKLFYLSSHPPTIGFQTTGWFLGTCLAV